MSAVTQYPCEQCGAQVEYLPGSTSLKCPYCGHETPIAVSNSSVEELPLEAYFDKARLDAEQETETTVKCRSCAATFTIAPNQVTQTCPFCGSSVLDQGVVEHRIPPNGVLPFVLKEIAARDYLGKWLGSRFWAPNDLKKMALKEGKLRPMYIPYWTFDSQTITQYTGQRGDYYYETETYRDSDGNVRTRQVRRTRWSFASGVVDVAFDDLLVLGSDAIPERYGQRLQNWTLSRVQPFEPKFLVGFQALRYDRDLATCWNTAQNMMQPEIDRAIRWDIGGDEQRISSKDTQYHDNTFKQLLLPVFAGAYRYRGKSYRVLVNGQSGEVQGEAPISVWKVLLAVLLGLLVLGTILYFVNQSQSQNPQSGTRSESSAVPF